MDRPVCECHGEPKHKGGFTAKGTQRWRCSIDNIAYAVPRRLEKWHTDPEARMRQAHLRRMRRLRRRINEAQN